MLKNVGLKHSAFMGGQILIGGSSGNNKNYGDGPLKDG